MRLLWWHMCDHLFNPLAPSTIYFTLFATWPTLHLSCSSYDRDSSVWYSFDFFPFAIFLNIPFPFSIWLCNILSFNDSTFYRFIFFLLNYKAVWFIQELNRDVEKYGGGVQGGVVGEAQVPRGMSWMQGRADEAAPERISLFGAFLRLDHRPLHL